MSPATGSLVPDLPRRRPAIPAVAVPSPPHARAPALAARANAVRAGVDERRPAKAGGLS